MPPRYEFIPINTLFVWLQMAYYSGNKEDINRLEAVWRTYENDPNKERIKRFIMDNETHEWAFIEE